MNHIIYGMLHTIYGMNHTFSLIIFMCSDSPAKRTRASTTSKLQPVLSRNLKVITYDFYVGTTNPILFRNEYHHLLINYKKTHTRRCTTEHKTWFKNQYKCFINRNLVRVWCGGYGRQIGYILYNNVYWQEVKDISHTDVACEGYPGKDRNWFIKNHMKGCSMHTKVAVFCFTFFNTRNHVPFSG